MTLVALSRILDAPEANLSANWPKIETCLDSLGCGSEESFIAALATVRVECPTFSPEREKYNGDPQTYFKRYEGRMDLGNTVRGDGFRYYGRGFIQITGRANYERYGKLLSLKLLDNPDLALVPDNAASIFAAFWQERGISEAADAENWVRVRKLVNGGSNGLSSFLGYVMALRSSLK